MITAGYLSDDIAHKYSDEYANVSVVDTLQQLLLAQVSSALSLKISGYKRLSILYLFLRK